MNFKLILSEAENTPAINVNGIDTEAFEGKNSIKMHLTYFL